MTTQADMMLMRALTMLGSGIGQGLDRRRQRKQDEEFADMIAPMSEPEDYMNPQDTQLIQALSGAVPGMAGMISGAGMQGNQMLGASAASGQQNQQAQQLRTAMRDPQIAAMMKQGYAQAQLSNMMPQVFQTNWGVFEKKPDGTLKTLTTPPKSDKPKDRWMNVDGNLYDTETVVDGAPKLAVKGTSDNGKVVKVGVGDKVSTAWYEPDTGKLELLGDPMSTTNKQEITTFDGSKPTKTTTGKIQTDLMSVDKTRAAYQRTLDSYDPKFLTYGDKAWRVIQGELDKSGAERIFGQILSDESWKEYEKATTFKQNVMKSVNAHIKELTGAQMSHYEIPRLMSEMPNMMDSGRAFKVKIDNVIAVADEAHATMAYYIKHNIIAPGFHDVYLETKKKWEGQASPAKIEEIAILEAAQAMAASAIANEIQFGGNSGNEGPGLDEDGLLPGAKIIKQGSGG
jgi:hypothetical protein